MDNLQNLQNSLLITFRDLALLQQAFVHRSYLNEAADVAPPMSNERLEFLGDAVLGLVVAAELYRRFPDLPEGQLTEMRAHLVRNATLARVGARLELGSFLVLGRGEEQSGGRRRSVNLGRALEAVLGAIYVDQGLDAVSRVVLRLLSTEFEGLDAAGIRLDAKSTLQQLAQASLHATPQYVTVSEEGRDHEREFVIQVRIGDETVGIGRGKNKRQAQQAAAAEAVAALSAPAVVPVGREETIAPRAAAAEAEAPSRSPRRGSQE